ncbi:MAG: hypothetical protein WCA21_20070 [Terracidiphilus sp.]
MERFAAAGFVSIVRALVDIGSEAQAYSQSDETAQAESVKDWRECMTVVGEECQKIGLTISNACTQDIVFALGYGMDVEKFIISLAELENTIRREMESNKFFYMPASQAEFYGQKELFGAKVNAKFPSIQFDMEEAGNCYAMGRGTACVFHLMRVMEVGVQQFGAKLGVMLVTEKNWQNIVDEINKAIKVLAPKALGTVEMSQASANLYCVKLAWRNEVMHPNDTYTLEEAENLIRVVRIFMGQLADIL